MERERAGKATSAPEADSADGGSGAPASSSHDHDNPPVSHVHPSEPPPASRAHPSDAPPASRAGPSQAPPGYQHRSTVAAKAFRGLFWMATTGIGSRVVSLIATLLLTRYVLPEDYGEVQNTFIVVWMVDLVTQLGLPQYIATRADIGPKHIHHATIYFHAAGVIGLAIAWALSGVMGPHFGAPHMSLYMPGFVFATLLQRIATVPDRILVRHLRFGTSSSIRAVSEVIYAVVSLALAAAGTRFDFSIAGHALVFGGGFCIVWGNIARGLFRVVATMAITHVKEWFAFIRLEKEISRQILAFGVPITIAGLGSIGARRWDNLVIGNLYGPATSGIYNFAYNLADVPPSVVGESLGDVLAPTFANVAPSDRAKELVRWVEVSGLVCFPLGVGLSAVAPSLSWMFNERWFSAVPMIILLGSLSLTRPVIGTVFAYLQALGRARTLMILEWAKAAGIVVVMFGIGRALRFLAPEQNEHYGPYIACAAVGVVMIGSTLSYQIIGARAGNIPARKVLLPLFRPLLACVPMVLAVLAVRFAFGNVSSKAWVVLRLVCEILAGGFVFVVAAFVIARQATRGLMDLLKSSIAKRRGG
jgi:PST family polysaccharide transporter